MNLGGIASLLKQHWPFAPSRSAVLAGYRALGAQYPQTLTDLALRNYVFTDVPETENPLAMARALGRQDAIKEVIRLAGADYAALRRLIENKPQQEDRP